MQMVVTEADAPTAGGVPLITYKAPPMQLELAKLVQGESLPSYPVHTRRVQRIWAAACDALLSDQAAMSELQVLQPAPACQLRIIRPVSAHPQDNPHAQSPEWQSARRCSVQT